MFEFSVGLQKLLLSLLVHSLSDTQLHTSLQPLHLSKTIFQSLCKHKIPKSVSDTKVRLYK